MFEKNSSKKIENTIKETEQITVSVRASGKDEVAVDILDGAVMAKNMVQTGIKAMSMADGKSVSVYANGECIFDVCVLNKNVYNSLLDLVPGLLDGSYIYMKFVKRNFEDLVFEKIGEFEYSMAHYYMQNGDCMRDPEITFSIDDENCMVIPLSFQQDNLGIFYETKEVTREERRSLMEFWAEWLEIIGKQGYELVTVYDETQD